jgi:probable HAF family extracellular repeat protein
MSPSKFGPIRVASLQHEEVSMKIQSLRVSSVKIARVAQSSLVKACLASITFLATLIMPNGLMAQNHSFARVPHYHLQVISTFGGPNSSLMDQGVPGGVFLNNSGALTGYADLDQPDPYLEPNDYAFIDGYVDHAFLRDDWFVTDLGVLPHGWSSTSLAISANGLIAGVAVNGELDPLIPGFPEQRAVLWKDGSIHDLGTLPEGGYESYANSVNSSGQVVGTAFNAIADSNALNIFNNIFSPTQARAFLWQNGVMQDLGALGGNDAAAFLINEWGQVTGWSYTSTTEPGICPLYPLAIGSFVWDEWNGMHNLGGFGSTCTLAQDMNNRGQIVGYAFTPEAVSRAFLWQNGSFLDLGGTLGGSGYTGAFVVNDAGQAAGFGGLAGNVYFHATFWPRLGQIIDLGTVGDDPCSSAKAINLWGQVVGDSINLYNCINNGDASRAFLWQDNTIFDLNALIPPNSPLYLVHPQNINDRGEIAGFGLDSSGNQHAFLLLPCDQNHPNIADCDYSLVDGATAQRTIAPPPQMPSPSAPSGSMHAPFLRLMRHSRETQ